MRRNDEMPSEANRPDGAPAPDLNQTEMGVDIPTGEEWGDAERAFLAAEGCETCGEDDPDVLDMHTRRLPACSAVQSPPGEPGTVFCDEHAPDVQTPREQAVSSLEDELVAAVVVYECERWEAVEHPTVDNAGGREIPAPRHIAGAATAPVRCRCGAEVDEIVYADGG